MGKQKGKPGPKEELHTLHPMKFGDALDAILRYKPSERKAEPKSKRKTPKKKTR